MIKRCKTLKEQEIFPLAPAVDNTDSFGRNNFLFIVDILSSFNYGHGYHISFVT